MTDIDFFKQYNDHYGHGAGDECLRKVVGALVAAVTRPGDLVARYGGEEFVVLMPDTDAEGARKIAERIRELVVAQAIPHEASAAAPVVTLSLGVASLIPDAGLTQAQLLEIADRRLYRAKAAGRNQVCASSEED